jgi:hypothetical protein
MEPSEDAPSAAAGPSFARLNSWPYRAEMGISTVAPLAILFYWRALVVRDLNVPLTVFWIVWPDLGAFVPIVLASRGGRSWPSWGPALYNALHTLLVRAPVFVLWSWIGGAIQWPRLGRAAHIAADRAVGTYLRAPALRPNASSRRSGGGGRLRDVD